MIEKGDQQFVTSSEGAQLASVWQFLDLLNTQFISNILNYLLCYIILMSVIYYCLVFKHKLFQSYGVFFMETSAASGVNVESAMLSLARHLKEKTDDDKGDIKKLAGISKQQGSCCRH